MVKAVMRPKASLSIIGCGTPTPAPGRFGSCLVLTVAGERLMFDCGPAATYKMVGCGIAPTEIGHLFFTHHHYDHNADTPCFLLCRWDHERPGVPRLKIYGPAPTAAITAKLIGPEGAFADDWRARIGHPASRAVYAARGGRLPRPAPRFDVADIAAGATIDTRRCRVTAGHAAHLQPLLACLCYRVEWDGGTLVLTGDAGRTPGLERFASGADTLVVNVWDHQEHMSETLAQGFCGTRDAAGLARAAGARRLVVAHQGPRLAQPGSRERAIADMAAVFGGEIIFGEESMRVDLDPEKPMTRRN
jgi:ribonuclease BN (tRNA processing enzyme)